MGPYAIFIDGITLPFLVKVCIQLFFLDPIADVYVLEGDGGLVD